MSQHRFQHPQVHEVSRTIEPWVVRAVAKRPHMTARNIAVALGVPEPIVQAARQELNQVKSGEQ